MDKQNDIAGDQNRKQSQDLPPNIYNPQQPRIYNPRPIYGSIITQQTHPYQPVQQPQQINNQPAQLPPLPSFAYQPVQQPQQINNQQQIYHPHNFLPQRTMQIMFSNSFLIFYIVNSIYTLLL